MAGDKLGSGVPKESLENQLAKRIDGLKQETEAAAKELLEAGFSERALTAFVSMHEYLNQLANSIAGEPEIEGKFLVEMQAGLRTIVHGLTMGSVPEGVKNRKYIAENPSALNNEMRNALKKAVGDNPIGGGETTLGGEIGLE